MGFFDIFKTVKQRFVYARMLNGQTPIFSQFGDNVYASDVVQQAIGCIVSEMKKLRPQHIVTKGLDIEPKRSHIQLVLENPNPIMTTSEFIEKIYWQLFLNFNSFIYKVYNSSGKLEALYPIAPTQIDFIEDPFGKLYVKLLFANGYDYTVPYDHVIHLKYRYSVNDFMGGNSDGQPDNGALLKTLELNDTLLQSVANAVKSSFSINGVIKYNTMLDGEKMQKHISELENNLRANVSGFLPLDLKGEFIPFQKQIKLVDKDTLQFIDSKILRQYGVSLPILSGDFTTDQLAAFYQKTIEPLVISLGQAFTKVLLTPTERAHGNSINFYTEELLFMSTDQKIEFVRLFGDSGTLFENEKRRIFGMIPLPELVGVRMQSLNYVNVSIASKYQLQSNQKSQDKDKTEDKEDSEKEENEEDE